jgi:hypothetical protein
MLPKARHASSKFMLCVIELQQLLHGQNPCNAWQRLAVPAMMVF